MRRKILSLILPLALIISTAARASDTGQYDSLACGQVVSDVKRLHPANGHPRLFADADGFEALRDEIEAGGIKGNWFREIKADTIRYSKREPIVYGTTDGIRMRVQSGQFAKIVSQNALIYKITGETSFADRAWREIEALLSWSSWNPYHFLDTGQFMNGMALGYDWLYDYLTPVQRRSMREALCDKGLKPTCDVYDGVAVGNDGKSRVYTWAFGKADNWTLECGSGAIMASLAICDEDESGYTNRVLCEGIRSFARGVKEYGPDGAWYEGVAYWQLATETAVECIESLNTAAGTDYGLSDIEGFSKAGLYPVEMTGVYTFNFSDAGQSPLKKIDTKEFFWFAERFSQPYLKTFRYNMMEKENIEPNYRELFYFKGNPNGGEAYMRRDAKYDNADAATMRSSWNTDEMLFCGLHAGNNKAAHGHLDIGEFVIDSMGDRFAADLGHENYNLPGKFFNKYRNRAEGHNVLVFNPDGRMYDQAENAHAYIDRFESGYSEAFAITDTTCAYEDYVQSAKRGIMLTDGRRRVVVTDEIKSTEENEIYWFMHTEAQALISEDGKSALLSMGDNRLKAEIVRGGTFEVMDAAPLPSSPVCEGQNPNTGYRKLAMHLENVKDTEICVAFTPERYLYELAAPVYVPLSEWSVSQNTDFTEKPKLSQIKLNGSALEGFSPDRHIYEIEADSYHSVSASGEGSIRITKPEVFPGTVEVTVTKNGASSVYALRYRKKERNTEGVIYTALIDRETERIVSVKTKTLDLSVAGTEEGVVEVPGDAQRYKLVVMIWTKEGNEPKLKKFLEYKE